MKLIVCLGNPGLLYRKTRHNIGFMVIDNILSNLNLSKGKKKFNGEYYEYNGEEKYIFLKPHSFMNLSGSVVKTYVDYFKISIDDIVVISDDLDMPTGKIRLREKGSPGGHNGLRDIENHLGTNEYKRIKIGIGNIKDYDTKKYVLGKFNKEEKKIISSTLEVCEDIIMQINNKTFKDLMNKYN